MTALSHLFNYLDNEGIDLQSRIETGDFISAHEGSLLTKQVASRTSTLSSLELFMGHIKNYLVWRLETFERALKPNRLSLKEQLKYNSVWLRQNIPLWIGKHAPSRPEMFTQTPLSLTPETLAELYELLTINGLKKYFEPRFKVHGVRNWLIISLFLGVGLRVSELQSIRIDTSIFPPKDNARWHIHIQKDPFPEQDPRAPKPGFKTRARVMEITDEINSIRELYETGRYIKKNGTKIRFRRTRSPSPYLFIANGKPISGDQIRKITKQVLESIGSDLLHPHALRHSFGSTFYEKVANLPTDLVIASIREAMGHSATSQTWQIYSKRAIQDQAKKVGLAIQDEFKKIEKDS